MGDKGKDKDKGKGKGKGNKGKGKVIKKIKRYWGWEKRWLRRLLMHVLSQSQS